MKKVIPFVIAGVLIVGLLIAIILVYNPKPLINTNPLQNNSLDKISNNSNSHTSNQNNSNNNPDTSNLCDSQSRFRCLPVTQGGAPSPSYSAPIVCGCLPIQPCPKGTFSEATSTEGKWPDGSNKGIFACSTNGPPS